MSEDEVQSKVDSPKDDYEETVRSTEESSLQVGGMLVEARHGDAAGAKTQRK